MATGPITQVSDVIVPSRFTSYVQQRTEEKDRLINSGAVQRSELISGLLQGGGLTFNIPSYKPLDNEDERVSTDAEHAEFGGGATPDPKKIETATEIAVRLNRNQSWSSADLAAALAGDDPMKAIGELVSDYWSLRRQAIFVAMMKGVFADNDAAPSASEHTQYDLRYDASNGGTYVAGTTDFKAEHFINSALTMGDSMGDLSLLMVHSVVYARMQMNNLIDFIPDARGEVTIPTFLGRQVIVDDGLPASSGVYESWLFGRGAVQFGEALPKVPTAVEREEGAGNGGGQEILYNRVQYCYHPTGHKFAASSIANGGPSNAATSNNLAHAGSWQRVYAQRKQIKIARLLTTES